MNKDITRSVLYIGLALLILFLGILNGRLPTTLPLVGLLVAWQVYAIIKARRNRSSGEREERTATVLREAETLEKTDPEAARRMLEQHFSAEQRGHDREIAELQGKAQYDVGAAKELRRRIRDDARAERSGRRFLVVAAFVNNTPSVLRPSLYGAAALFVIVAFRMLFASPVLLQHPAEIPKALLVLAAATAAGAAGGLGYTIVGRPLRRLPVVGPYLAGVASVGGYMAALALVLPLIDPTEHLISDQTDAIAYSVGTVFFGLIVGHAAFRKGAADYTAGRKTNWRLVGGLILVALLLMVAMKLAGWW